ncbi:MAG TPA: V-type ATP synthase subunit D, partial [Candidatus Galloscillospira stercoripullorum]|nr:V-type ATP synthase subunit D [Candidatus Galloscillospira stercoripullorum]
VKDMLLKDAIEEKRQEDRQAIEAFRSRPQAPEGI